VTREDVRDGLRAVEPELRVDKVDWRRVRRLRLRRRALAVATALVVFALTLTGGLVARAAVDDDEPGGDTTPVATQTVPTETETTPTETETQTTPTETETQTTPTETATTDTEPPPPPEPNLVAEIGDDEWTVRNDGEADAGMFTISVDRATIPVSGLAAGDARVGKTRENCGVTVTADPDDRVTESDEEDNTRSQERCEPREQTDGETQRPPG
jgi:hypothetical protein